MLGGGLQKIWHIKISAVCSCCQFTHMQVVVWKNGASTCSPEEKELDMHEIIEGFLYLGSLRAAKQPQGLKAKGRQTAAPHCPPKSKPPYYLCVHHNNVSHLLTGITHVLNISEMANNTICDFVRSQIVIADFPNAPISHHFEAGIEFIGNWPSPLPPKGLSELISFICV